SVPENIDKLSIQYEVAFKKHTGTYKPQIGLLFVKGTTVGREAGSNKIKSLLTKGQTNNYYQDGGDIVYHIGTDISKVKDTITTSFVPLELGATYHVYFFLL